MVVAGPERGRGEGCALLLQGKLPYFFSEAILKYFCSFPALVFVAITLQSKTC